MGGMGAMMGGMMGGQMGGQIMQMAGDALKTMVEVREAKKAFRRQKDFYKRRHTWEVHDLRSAGLNPMLSLRHGAVGVPPIASARAQHSTSGPDFTRGPQVASAIKLMQEQMKTERAKQNDLNSKASANTSLQVKHLYDADRARAETQLLRTQLPGRLIEQKIDESDVGEAVRWIQRFNPVGGTAKGIMRLRPRN